MPKALIIALLSIGIFTAWSVNFPHAPRPVTADCDSCN